MGRGRYGESRETGRRGWWLMACGVAAAALLMTVPGLAAWRTMSHSFDVQLGSGQVCTDGAIYEGRNTAASSLNILMTAQVWDSTGTTVLATGNSHTFTTPGESFTFTVMGSFTAGSTVVLAVSNTPGTPPAFGTEGDAITETVGDCTLPIAPALPFWAGLLLALALLAGGALLARRRRPQGIAAGGVVAAVLLALTAAPAAASVSYPNLQKAFAPATIGPGSTSKLTFTIDNSKGMAQLQDLAFTDTLPAGMAIADPASAFTNCVDATLSAPDGGTTITFSGGRLGAGASCTVMVNVTTATTGMNVSGNLTSNAASSPHGTASATLTVDNGRPGFSKSFSPSSIPKNGISTLTFLIDNSSNSGSEGFVSFSDNLPAGVVVAAVPNTTIMGCGPVPFLTANPGSSTISFSSLGTPAVAAMGTCTVSVDVTATANGSFDNVSSDLDLVEDETAGFATDTLEVPLQSLNKAFTDDPVRPGTTVTLEFTIQNPSRTSAATDVGFTDNLDSVISGLAPSGPLPSDPCGTGSSLSFAGGVLTLSDGALAAGGSCTFSVTLLVPSGASSGSYGNTTSALMATIDGEGFTGNTASDVLFVTTAPTLTKSFTDDPVGAGGTVTLRFMITNVSSATSATNITFTDDLASVLSGLAPSGPLPATPCGAGSSLTFNIDGVLTLTGGSLAAAGMAGDSCTFDVTLSVPKGSPGGVFPNATSPISATVDGSSQGGPPATDNLTVVAAPSLRKEFTDDPVAPGGTVTLEFTLDYDPNATVDATGIGFTDNLDAVVSGLAPSGMLPSMPCGTGSSLSFSLGVLTLSGGTLAPGASCTFSVTLSVPGGASSGNKKNTTSDVTATVGGVAVTGTPAEDDLRVSGLLLTKMFMDTPPAIPGGTVVLRFTLTNNVAGAATGIGFTDDLDANLPGLKAAMPLPSMGCGGTIAFSDGDKFLTFTGGSVGGNSSCFFDVTLDVPAMSDGEYGNTTSAVTYSGGTSGPAFDTLTVDSELLALTKEFTDDPTAPGGTVTLEIKVTNLDGTRPASAIAFTDDLGAALAGLTISSVLFDDCGGTASGVGTTMLSYSGGSLAAGGMCTLRLSLTVPAGPLPGNTFLNTTSPASGTIAGLAVNGSPASDTLRVFTLKLEKSFSKTDVVAGESFDLTFTITNLDSSAGVSLLSFSDSLPAGLKATSLPATPCGAGSTISGSTFLTFSNGSLGPSGTCMFTVTVQVPTPAIAGSFVNTTSQLFQSGLPVAGTASAPLTVHPPPTFSKSFAPDPILVGFTSKLTFTINNMASGLAATGLAFLDMLPFGLEVAADPMLLNGCGGSVVAPAGSATISLSGGSVAAGASCTLSIAVVANFASTFANTTGDLTSSSGNSGTASDTLTAVGCAAPDGLDLTLENDLVLGTEMYTVCRTITIKQHYKVLGPNGKLTLRAGVSVIISSGVEFAQGSEVSITIDPSLATP